jgi:hypothetical protein
MYKLILLLSFLFIFHLAEAQTVKLTCFEKEKKNDDGKYPILVKTCFIKNYKFISFDYPDYVGRYYYRESKVYVKVNNKYVRTTNSKIFSKKQEQLLDSINNRIQRDFISFSTDSNTKECFRGVDSIPRYNMDDLKVSFYEDEIWFEVNWDLPIVCKSVDGATVSFKIKEIAKYLK